MLPIFQNKLHSKWQGIVLSRMHSVHWGILKNKECVLYRVNGIEDHIHIFTHVHPTIAISDLIKDNDVDFDEKYLL